jgi:hypothetical protein
MSVGRGGDGEPSLGQPAGEAPEPFAPRTHTSDCGEELSRLFDELLSLLDAAEGEVEAAGGRGAPLAIRGYSRHGRGRSVVLVQRLGQVWLSNRATNMALSWARALETDTATRLHLPFSSRWMAIPSLALRLSALEK